MYRHLIDFGLTYRDTSDKVTISDKKKLKTRSANLSGNIIVYATNCKSLMNKINLMQCLTRAGKVDVIAITESWMGLENKHFSTEFELKVYVTYLM